MIKQCVVTDIESRSECNVFDENGFLPLITAPMYSVTNEKNYKTFLEHKIQVCLPRNESRSSKNTSVFESYSLDDFINIFVEGNAKYEGKGPWKICIDTAAGHLLKLHKAIKDAKVTHGDNLIIMAGNVANARAFCELARTGCDYVRVGIGGSSVCNTTTQTGVGNDDILEGIIWDINADKRKILDVTNNFSEERIIYQHNNLVRYSDDWEKYSRQDYKNIVNCKIVADGITRYMNDLIAKGEALDNGYAAINRLLNAGADLVMIGRLFAQSHESAGEKQDIGMLSDSGEIYGMSGRMPDANVEYNIEHDEYVDYYGMSTKKAQEQYKPGTVKPSEGNSKWIPVKWTLDEWLNGKEGDDYLIGYTNALRSAMSYTGSKTLKEFKQ